jgi:hypothetical protein
VGRFVVTIAGLLAVFGACIAASIVFDAWVIHTLYGWFIPVAFTSAPTLSVAQVAGVLLVFRGARGYRLPENKKDDSEDPSDQMWKVIKRMFFGMVIAFMSLGIGWCVRFFL